MNLYYRLTLLCLFCIPCITGCSTSSERYNGINSSTVILGNQDNGKDIKVRQGDIILIELEQSAATGYNWYPEESYKKYFDLIKRDKEEISRKGITGTPVIMRWQFKAVKEGKTELKFYLYRDWEGKNKAASLFHVKVNIL